MFTNPPESRKRYGENTRATWGNRPYLILSRAENYERPLRSGDAAGSLFLSFFLPRVGFERGCRRMQVRTGVEVLFRSPGFRLGTATCVNANLKTVTRPSAGHDKARRSPRPRETLFGNSVAPRTPTRQEAPCFFGTNVLLRNVNAVSAR
jgi:hypothetical protein